MQQIENVHPDLIVRRLIVVPFEGDQQNARYHQSLASKSH
jgi:hypothetical protein